MSNTYVIKLVTEQKTELKTQNPHKGGFGLPADDIIYQKVRKGLSDRRSRDRHEDESD